MTNYTPENVLPELKWPFIVRERPGMYFGGINSVGMHRLVWYVIDHAIDEALAKQGCHVDIVLQDANVISISDNGVGLPVERDPETERPVLELILTARRGRKFSDKFPRLPNYSMNLAWVNAVAAELSVQVRRNGFLWQQRYKQGNPQTELEQVRALESGEQSGTTMTFSPDFSIFDPCEMDYSLLSQRCRELAFLLSGLTIVLTDQRSAHEQRIHRFIFADGLKQYLSCLNQGYPVLHEPIVIRKTVELERHSKPLGFTADIEIALQYAQLHQPILLGFVNTFEVEQGGTHIRGFVEALTHVISSYASEKGMGGWYTFIEDDIVCGLAAVLNIWHPTPEFAGSARYELMNSELEDAIYQITRDALEAFSIEHPDQMQRIIEKCLQNKALRLHRRYSGL
ncbi:MAG: hypothetical protein KF716_34565 [Anaerolineae bacterium]|nr:hypothetical protein [Anaerolineae bacterium]